MQMPLVCNRDSHGLCRQTANGRARRDYGAKASCLASKPFFTLLMNKHRHPDEIRQDCTQPCVPPTHPSMMEDFIKRTLRERRTLQGALADMLAKCDRIPSGQERSMLERTIELLKEEIALRRDRRHVMN